MGIRESYAIVVPIFSLLIGVIIIYLIAKVILLRREVSSLRTKHKELEDINREVIGELETAKETSSELRERQEKQTHSFLRKQQKAQQEISKLKHEKETGRTMAVERKVFMKELYRPNWNEFYFSGHKNIISKLATGTLFNIYNQRNEQEKLTYEFVSGPLEQENQCTIVVLCTGHKKTSQGMELVIEDPYASCTTEPYAGITEIHAQRLVGKILALDVLKHIGSVKILDLTETELVTGYNKKMK